jgi:hypothetical protein
MVVEAEWARVVSARSAAWTTLAPVTAGPHTPGRLSSTVPGRWQPRTVARCRACRIPAGADAGFMAFSRLLAAALAAGLGLLPEVEPPVPAWGWPLSPPHTVTRPFEAPPTTYAAGHRGVDLAAGSGDPVYAPAEGVVSFAGVVVDRPVLSITHAGDLVSSIEPVTATVAEGAHVAASTSVFACTADTYRRCSTWAGLIAPYCSRSAAEGPRGRPGQARGCAVR